MKKIISISAVIILCILLCTSVYAGITNESIEISNISKSSISIKGNNIDVKAAVVVQVLDDQTILAMESFKVLNGSFTGVISGLQLVQGKAYTVRVADYDGGNWITKEVEVPNSTPTPKPPVTPSNPDPTVAPTASPAPTVEPTPTPTPAPTAPTMAPVSEEVSDSVNKEVASVVEEITKGNDTTGVDSTTADKIKEAVEQGKEIVTEIVSDTVKKEEVVGSEVTKIADKIKEIVTNNTTTAKQSIINIAQYINLEIVIKADDTKLGNLTELSKPVEFTIAIPEKLKVKNRKFFVIRVHNGVVTKLDTVMNEDGTLSFETDRFSTYALAYEDEVAKPTLAKNVKLAARGTYSLRIGWDKVAGATGYRVYVVKDGKWTRVDETKVNTYTYKNLSAGKSYKFAVRPYKIVSGKVVWANTYTPVTTCTKPAVAKGIKAVTVRRTYVTTTWRKVSGATAYRVYIARGGKWVKLGTPKSNKFTFKGLKRNTKYKIAVKPIRMDGKIEVTAATHTSSYIKTKK